MNYLINRNRVFNADISQWNVSQVTSMRGMFQGAVKFNQNISQWDVSRVTNMSHMFRDAVAFNQDVSKWDVSRVERVVLMFAFSPVFNQDLSPWDVSRVKDMGGMFFHAMAFNQQLSEWDVSRVTAMDAMFADASSFQHALCWDLHPNVNTNNMFRGTKSDGFDCSTESPSAGPTPTNSDKCTDKYSRVFQIWNFSSTCQILSKHSVSKREKWCKFRSVFRSCPDTCDGKCICNDNTLSTFFLWGKQRNCSWLIRKPLNRKLFFCRKFPQVKGACEDTCNGWC